MGLLMHANLEAIACCATLTAGGQPYRSTKVETFDAERSNLSSTIAAWPSMTSHANKSADQMRNQIRPAYTKTKDPVARPNPSHQRFRGREQLAARSGGFEPPTFGSTSRVWEWHCAC